MKRTFRFGFPILAAAIALLWITLAAFGASGFLSFSETDAELPDAPYFSVEHFTEADGNVAEVYASGDQYYNYLHDRKGRILIPDDGYLFYAKADGGRPVSSGARYGAPERKIRAAGTMTAADLDLSKNPELLNDFGELGEPLDFSAAKAASGAEKIANSVVFLKFPDESGQIVTDGVFRALSNTEGERDTLNDYFETVSAGEFGFYNALPYDESGELFVYTAEKPISYYRSLSATGLTRQREEGKLLGAALAAAKPYLERSIAESGCPVDADGDGAVDSVTFMVLSDEPGNDAWNTLLWPHQWDFSSVFVSDTLAGARAGRYLFMFTSSTRFFPVLTHEMGHVVGAPDLYHYEGGYDPVGNYDNMASGSSRAPNLWLTATREKYLAGAVKEWQVAEIAESWDGYTLKATAAAGVSDTLAYKIRLSASEWLYLEYRAPGVGRYDNNFTENPTGASAAPGLVVYRKIDGVTGNEKGVSPQSGTYASHPDELYVFRNSKIETAALNLRNPSIGSETDNSLYKDGNIYTKNGRNTGIVVTVREIDTAAHAVRFEVKSKNLPEYSGVNPEAGAIVGLSVSGTEERSDAGTVTETPFGSTPELPVYPVYLRGTARLLGENPLPPSFFTTRGFDPEDKSLAPQTVTLTFDAVAARAAGYPIADGAALPELRFRVLVTDYNKELAVLSLAKSKFIVGTTGGFVGEWKLVTAMGRTAGAYNLTSPETAELRYEGIDPTAEGAQTVTVCYGSLSTAIEVVFYDTEIGLKYAGEDAYTFGDTVPTLAFELLYQSGRVKPLSFPSEEVGFSAAVFGAQSVRAEFRTDDGRTLVGKAVVYAYKTVSGSASYRLLKDGAEAPTAIGLRYAETLNLESYALGVTFRGETTETLLPLGSRISAENKMFTLNRDVSIDFPEARLNGKTLRITLRITVPLREDESVLSFSSKQFRIDYKNKLIVSEIPFTAADLRSAARTANYLSVSARGTDGGSGLIVEVKNAISGETLSDFRFTAVLKGDANGDGVLTREDLDGLAAYYLEDPSALRAAIGDKDGDGSYTLKDFTLWIGALSGEADDAA